MTTKRSVWRQGRFSRTNSYRVSCAPDGEVALAGLESESYDLVLSDMVMGKMSGIDLLKELKRRRPEMPVIMVTGSPPSRRRSRRCALVPWTI